MSKAKLDVWVEGLDHPESVTTDAHGVIYAGGEAGQFYRITLDGAVSELGSTGGFVLGLALDGDDNLYACDLKRRELVRRDAATGEIHAFSAGSPERPFRTPNYPAFAADGRIFVTDSGDWLADDGVIFVVDADGTHVWSEAVTGFPNACAVTPAGDALIVVESTRPGLTRVPILEDGAAGEPEHLVTFPADVVPDGVALCADGGAIVSCYRPDAIFLVGPDGTVDELARDPHGTLLAAPTDVVFRGDDLATIVVANLGRWHLAYGDAGTGVRGVRLHYPLLS